MFAGKFFSCNMVTEAGLERVSIDVAANKEECRKLNSSLYVWTNPQVNFDNVLNGYLCLFQVVSSQLFTLFLLLSFSLFLTQLSRHYNYTFCQSLVVVA